MSVHAYETADGTRHQVRWREGARVRTRSFASKKAAAEFDIDVKARKQKGEAMPRPGKETLATAYDQWWRFHAATLATNTQNTYQSVWDAHVRDRFDHHRLIEWVTNPQLFDELIADMREREVGNASQRKVLVVMSAVFAAAVQWKKLGVNPVLAVRKPAGTRKRIPRPFPPLVVERIRVRMLRRQTKDTSGARAMGDACLVTLMSYAGLRPGEALALTWGDIGVRTLAIDKAISDGESGPTKTGTVRSAPLVDRLATDLRDFRRDRGSPSDDQLVFPASDGGHWSRSQYNNWRSRVWKPVVEALASGKPPQPRLATARPYDCRGSFVSLQLRAGASPLEVASWAGHSPQVMFAHYANVIEELVGEPTLSAEDQISRARKIVEVTEAYRLNQLMGELIECPTVSASAGPSAARLLYEPKAGS